MRVSVRRGEVIYIPTKRITVSFCYRNTNHYITFSAVLRGRKGNAAEMNNDVSFGRKWRKMGLLDLHINYI